MSLSADARARYERQVLVPEIGHSGQARLCAAKFAPTKGEAANVAALYLERAGLQAHESAAPVEAPRIAGNAADKAALEVLAGALAAVERIKAELALGSPLNDDLAFLEGGP